MPLSIPPPRFESGAISAGPYSCLVYACRLPLAVSTDIQAEYAAPAAQGYRLFGAWPSALMAVQCTTNSPIAGGALRSTPLWRLSAPIAPLLTALRTGTRGGGLRAWELGCVLYKKNDAGNHPKQQVIGC